MAVAHHPITGLDDVLGNMNERIARLRGFTKRGMHEAVLLVRGEALSLTPVDTGHLRRSQYGHVIEGNEQVVGVIGYSADYAIYVHEIDKHYKAPGTQWKFLQTALQRNESQIVELLARSGREAFV